MIKVTLEQHDIDNSTTVSTVEQSNAVSLTDVCDLMEQALRGLGFHFEGHLEIVEDEE
jgi:hypothetical protein